MLSYEVIFSRVRNKIDDPKELSLDNDSLNEVYVERLHSAIGNQRIRNLFSTITLDDEIEVLDYKLKQSVDELADNEYVIEVLTLSIVIDWLRPRVDSVLFTAPMIGGKEEKKILDSHKIEIERLSSLEVQLSKKIRDYGSMYNNYVRGRS